MSMAFKNQNGTEFTARSSMLYVWKRIVETEQAYVGKSRVLRASTVADMATNAMKHFAQPITIFLCFHQTDINHIGRRASRL